MSARILAAARALLVRHGYGGLTMDAVARAARVGRQTIYRRWAGKPLLVFEAMFGDATLADRPAVDTGSLGGDLAAVTAGLASAYADPLIREVITGMLADGLGDPVTLTELQARFLRPRVATVGAMAERSARRQELAADVDPHLVGEVIAGAHVFKAIILGEPPDPAWSAALARLVTRGAT